ncbi:MAG: hypothetical protein CL825_03370 [Crocinitomicaceae bacterium]|nr:hypothetical protein [Crocinitomicaceae bacterium]
MILYYYPQWICICTWRFLKLFTESLWLFPCRFSSIPRFVLVALLSIFALLISYLHLSIVFIEHVAFSLFGRVKPYPTVFIIGPPRSGTTHMHKLLATDTNTFSSMKMWELFFAPAVSQKLLLIGVGKIDAFFGQPFFKFIQFVEKKVFKDFNSIHKLGLFNVEEDALILFHLFSSYHLSFLIGKERSYKHLNYDNGVPKAVWAYYKICVDNHMRLNRKKTYLSKNPFFSGSSESLSTLFKASKFIYMDRAMNQVAPSFFSLKIFLYRLFYGKQPDKIRCKSILDTLLFWREAPVKGHSKSVTIRADFKELTTEPVNLVNKVYQFMGIKMGAEYKNELVGEAQRAKSYKSEHRYSSTAFDLDSLNPECF